MGNYIGWSQREFLKQDIKRGGRVLEIGCGTGDFVALANRSGYRVVGVDLDKEAVLVGKNYWKIDSILAVSAEEYFSQNNGEKFDIICFFAVLEHLSSPHQFFAELKTYLNSDGYVVFAVPNSDSPLQWLWRKVTRVIDYPPQHLTRWSRRSIEIFLRLHDFETVSRKTCRPTVTDMIIDLYKLYSPPFLRTSAVLTLSRLTCKIMSPLNLIVKKFVKEGRNQLVIARLKERSG